MSRYYRQDGMRFKRQLTPLAQEWASLRSRHAPLMRRAPFWLFLCFVILLPFSVCSLLWFAGDLDSDTMAWLLSVQACLLASVSITYRLVTFFSDLLQLLRRKGFNVQS